jgi:hypothetical protein
MAESKFDMLLDDIIKTTRSRQTRWHVTPTDAFADSVMHGGFIFRSYSGSYQRDGEPYTLGFVEKKAPHEDSDDERIEMYIPELLVFKDDRLILTISKYHVDVDSLRSLAALIADRNDDAASLLNKF